jgi:hypothetical protein
VTIANITDYVIFGAQSDTKPLAGIAANTLFFEIDTGDIYKFTGGVWSLFSGRAKQETLTNKTLTLPIISSISNSGTITLPTGTRTLVGRDTTDTLTNKTLTFPVISTISNGGIITLPTGTRTLVARDTADTLLSKTISVNSNTITATSQAVGDILINNGTQFVRLARGANGQVLTATATTINWAAATGGSGGSVRQAVSYLIYYTGTQYEALNGNTGTVDYTSTTDAASVINSAITTASTAGGGIIHLKQGTYLIRSIIVAKNNVWLRGSGEGTIIKQDTTQNLAAMMRSNNFTTLSALTSGSGGTGGVESFYLSDLVMDGNKANNTVTATDGIQFYGYNFHVSQIHIRQTKGRGLYTEWSNSGTVLTNTSMENHYSHLKIHDTGLEGWTNRGAHDWEGEHITIYDATSHGYIQEGAAGYDGSGYVDTMHIFACDGLYGAWIKAGTFRYTNLTCETCANGVSGAGGIGLYVSATGSATGTGFWAYGSDTGVRIEGSGGTSQLTESIIENNYFKGAELLRNNIILNGQIANNGASGVIIGNGTTSVANIRVSGYISGHTTSQIDFGNGGNQGVTILASLYLDSTNPTPITGENNIDFTKNTILLEQVTNGTTAIRTRTGKAITDQQAKTGVFYRRYGDLTLGHGAQSLSGLLTGATINGTPAYSTDSFEGTIATIPTGTTANTRIGLNGAASGVSAFITRRMYPTLEFRCKTTTNATNNKRLYVGFSTATAIPASDTPLGTTDKGIIVGYNSTLTNFSVWQHNGDGTAAAAPVTYSGLTLAKTDGSWNRISISTDDLNAKFNVSINNNAVMSINTKIPATGDFLAVYAVFENVGTTSESLTIGSTIELKTNYLP